MSIKATGAMPGTTTPVAQVNRVPGIRVKGKRVHSMWGGGGGGEGCWARDVKSQARWEPEAVTGKVLWESHAERGG